MRYRRCGIVLQARMGSTRLPGKVMRPMAGRPMIGWIIERLRHCRRPDALVLATSTSAAEQPLVAWAEAHGVTLFRGDEHDVLDRYLRCAEAHDLDAVVRATGDNPFVDAAALDALVDCYAASPAAYACALPGFGSGLPIGVGVEVMSREALQASHAEGHEPHHREHVDEYILEHPERFGRAVYVGTEEQRAPELVLTVDTLEQFEQAERIHVEYRAAHGDEPPPLGWAIDWLRRHG